MHLTNSMIFDAAQCERSIISQLKYLFPSFGGVAGKA